MSGRPTHQAHSTKFTAPKLIAQSSKVQRFERHQGDAALAEMQHLQDSVEMLRSMHARALGLCGGLSQNV